jgi:hypothetical protein
MTTIAPSTFAVPNRDTVSPANQAIFDARLKGVGIVPNLYATFAHSETALGDVTPRNQGSGSRETSGQARPA